MLAGLRLLPATGGGTAGHVAAQLERATTRGLFLERRRGRLARWLVLFGAGLGQRLVQRAFGLRCRFRIGDDRRRRGRGFFRCRCDRFGRLGGGFLGLLFLLGLPLLRLILLLLHIFLLLGDQCRALARFFFARGEFRRRDDRLARRGFFHGRRGLGAVALDEHALLAHFDLDRARASRAVRRLDFGRLLARERNLLFQLHPAVLLAQVVEQSCLVLLGELVAFLLAADAGSGQLLEQDARRHFQFGREFLDRGQGHVFLRALARLLKLGGLVPRFRRFQYFRTSGRAPS